MGCPLPAPYKNTGDRLKPKKEEVIDLLLSSDDENDKTKVFSKRHPTNTPNGLQKTSDDRPGLQRIKTNATPPESLTNHARAASKDSDNKGDGHSVPRAAKRTLSSHAPLRNEVSTMDEGEQKRVFPDQLRLDMSDASPAQLNYVNPPLISDRVRANRLRFPAASEEVQSREPSLPHRLQPNNLYFQVLCHPNRSRCGSIAEHLQAQ